MGVVNCYDGCGSVIPVAFGELVVLIALVLDEI
jgi:hypothetical protein